MDFNQLVTLYGPFSALLIFALIILWRDNLKLRRDKEIKEKELLDLVLAESEHAKKMAMAFVKGENTINVMADHLTYLVKVVRDLEETIRKRDK